MKVLIKDFNVDMEIKSNGIEFEVRSPDGTEHLGDLVIQKARVIWCPGKTTPANGIRITWSKFIEIMQGHVSN